MGESLRHAYLIIAHHRPDLLHYLLDAIDDERNDIFVHIDIKAGEEMDENNFSVKHASLTFLHNRLSISWGGYSQIEVALRLLTTATRAGKYSYYHLLTGATYPTMSQNEIHSFFYEHAGKQFIEYVDVTPQDRVRYIWIPNENGRAEVRWDNYPLGEQIEKDIQEYQDKHYLYYDKLFDVEFKKGLAYWSITDDFARYVVKKHKLIKRMFKYSRACDELFMQTMVWNSPFKETIFKDKNGNTNSLRISSWNIEGGGGKRENHNFLLKDFDFIQTQKKTNSQIFAFKFEGPDGVALIQRIKETIEKCSCEGCSGAL